MNEEIRKRMGIAKETSWKGRHKTK